MGMNFVHLTRTLVESFNSLADEVQSLTDRKTVLEHKLRFAHEQFQYLADKHAPAAPEISETLAKLQLPPELAHPSLQNATSVPLPRRGIADANHHIALLIRDGRRVAQQLVTIAEPSKTSLSSKETFSRLSGTVTSMSTAALEQDFTVEGKRGTLSCPFSAPQPQNTGEGGDDAGEEADPDPTPHRSTDPICAGMVEEAASQPAPAAASKCPIRYMDQHSPEEIAHYVKTHKHDLPRSHAICVERYQKNETQIRKLDAKYGNIVSMIEGLGQLHKPMLPVSEDPPDHDVDRDASNQRVENWAQDVSANASDFPAEAELPTKHEGSEAQGAREESAQEPDREGRFDRPMKEIRVGESPSRPWGISIPIYEYEVTGSGDKTPPSPPPAPVLMPAGSEADAHEPSPPPKPAGKCPFDHTKFAGPGGLGLSHPSPHDNAPEASRKPPTERPCTPQKEETHTRPTSPPRPTFLNPPQLAQAGNGNTPQMVFTGPVFIGYPMDDAIRFMQAFQGR